MDRLVRAVVGFFAATIGVALIIQTLRAQSLIAIVVQIGAGLILLMISYRMYVSLSSRDRSRR